MFGVQKNVVVRQRAQRGFTLLELLIVISIMLILVAITAAAIRINADADRVRGAGRAVQSYLLGARDRAIYAKEPRGVRFYRDATNPRTVTSLVYVQQTDPWIGQVTLLPFNSANPWSSTNALRRVRLTDPNASPDWQTLQNNDLLQAGQRIRIPANDSGNWYVIQTIQIPDPNTPNTQDLILSTEFRNPNPTGSTIQTAQIELPPSVVPDAETLQLPKGVVIDLDRCTADQAVAYGGKLPASWRTGAAVAPYTFTYTNQMDLMFSPRGAIYGSAAGTGIVHFYITDQAAADLQLDAAYGVNMTGTVDPPIPDKIAVTVFTRTGSVIVSQINTTDNLNNNTAVSPGDGRADDPFYYAERGEIAGR